MSVTERFFGYCETKREELLKEAARLAAEGRGDESHLARMKANIYDLCQSMCAVEYKRRGEKKACLAALAHLKEEWEAARAYAADHEDIEKAAVAEIKLETLADAAAKLGEEEA